MTDQPTTNQPTKFSDASGREWVVALDFAVLQRIRDTAQVDLGNIERLAESWASLLYDDLKALSVVWCCIERAAGDVSRDEYLAAMNGDTLQEALAALGAAIQSFTQPRKRGMAARAIQGVTKGMQLAIEQAETQIEAAMAKTMQDGLAALGTSPPSAKGY